jgi:WD40 repeat protein
MKKRIIIGIIVSISLLVLCYYQFSYKSQRVHDGVITLYHTVLAHTNQIWAVKFSPDNKTFATGGVDSSVKLWDNETAKMIKEYKMPSGITYLCFSPDGKYISFLSSRYDSKHSQVWLMDRRGGEGKKLTTIKGEVQEYKWSPDGTRIILAITDTLNYDTSKEKNPKPHVIDRVHFKQDMEGFLDSRHTHLYLRTR